MKNIKCIKIMGRKIKGASEGGIRYVHCTVINGCIMAMEVELFIITTPKYLNDHKTVIVRLHLH